jgi:hypothetical protein
VRLELSVIFAFRREETTTSCHVEDSRIAQDGNVGMMEERQMTSRRTSHRPQFDWLADFTFLGSLIGVALLAAALCSILPWS